MRVVLQRVKEASVAIDGKNHASIKAGLMLLLGIEEDDEQEEVEWLCGKIARLRIFDDSNGIMNLSLQEIEGEVLLISQFTLHASTKKGNRPSYIKAAKPPAAIPFYENFIATLGLMLGADKVKTGIFGAMMDVSLINNGPVTIIIDSKNKE